MEKQRRLPEEFKKTKGIAVEGMRKLPKIIKAESTEPKTKLSTDGKIENQMVFTFHSFSY